MTKPNIGIDNTLWVRYTECMITSKCSCGYKIQTETADQGQEIIYQHFADNIDTHLGGAMTVGSFLHIPTWDARWYHKIFRGIKKKLRNP